MHRKAVGLWLALLLAFPLAAGRAHAATDSGETTIQLFERLAQVISVDKDDCAKMAAGIDHFTDDNAAAIQRINESTKKMTAEQKRAWAEKYRERIKAATLELVSGLKTCGGNKDVRAAMGRLGDMTSLSGQ